LAWEGSLMDPIGAMFGARSAIDRRYDAGATIDSRRSGETTSDGCDILFVIDAQGQLTPATQSAIPAPRTGDTVIVLARQLPPSGRWPGRSRDPV
jgi:hypothetical protein